MTSNTKSCYIYDENKVLSTVYLPDKEEVFVGRSIDTKIADTQCSRQQIRLFANYLEQKVYILHVGRRPSCLNGHKFERGEEVIAHHGDNLEILQGKHRYTIEFNPPPSLPTLKVENNVKKRILSQDSDEEINLENYKKNKISEDSNILKSDSGATIEKEINEPQPSGSGVPTSKNNVENGLWEEFFNKSLHVYTPSSCKGQTKIASYDMDNTLIKTQSGNVFPKNCDDWQLLYPDIPGKLKKLHENGFKLVIFSNQSGLASGKINLEEFKSKIEKIVKKLGAPIQAFFAVGETVYRKPRPGMWEFLSEQKNENIPIDINSCFYVGDAAGRPATAFRKKKDHSLVDRLFAKNLNLLFYTPEEHFLGHKKETYNPPSFEPEEALKNTKLCDPNVQLVSNNQEIIIMVGSPGSGKSHFVKNNLPNYFYINRDTLGTWQKCVSKAEEALKQGKHVVIDNTNPDLVSRERYINIGKKLNIPVRCFLMVLKPDHVKHNNIFRNLTDTSHQKISTMVIHSYFKSFVEPKLEEGFAEIVKIYFVPSFKTDKERKLYKLYLLEN